MKNTYVFYSAFQVKKLQNTATRFFISCCFTTAFTSVDITFYNFSELDSKLCKKKIFVTYFPFLTDSPPHIPPHPPTHPQPIPPPPTHLTVKIG